MIFAETAEPKTILCLLSTGPALCLIRRKNLGAYYFENLDELANVYIDGLNSVIF